MTHTKDEALMKVLFYDKHSGDLFWTDDAPKLVKGKKAGTKSMGYIVVCFKGKHYKSHRVAWLLAHGSWPEGEIDHINGDKLDNRLCNLRDVSKSVNQQNLKQAKADNKVGLLGVSMKGNRFRAQITINQKKKMLGTFATATEAHEAYIKAKRQIHIGGTL
jgi:hypothetical protein